MKKEVTLFLLEKDLCFINHLQEFVITSDEFIAAYATEEEAEQHRLAILKGMLMTDGAYGTSVHVKKIQFPLTVAQKMLVLAEEQR